MRLIDGDALRDKLLELASDDWNQMCRTFWANVYNECADMVDNQPTIDPQKWVPCSERLPKDNGDYLVTRNRMGLYSYVDIVTKTNVVDKIASDIKAWMPLPEPYEKKE